MKHLPVAVGWNQTDPEGWAMECTCGKWFGPSMFMAEIGEEWDDHLRADGTLVDEGTEC